MEDGKLSRFLTYAGVILGAAFTIAIGVYLVATANPSVPGKTVIRWCVDPNPIRKEQIKLFESMHPDIRRHQRSRR